METNLKKTTTRFAEVDALRGFALIAIFLIHCNTKFNYPSTYVESNPFFLKTDHLIITTYYYLFMGKIFPIFAMFFGLTFYIQHRNQNNKGRNFDGRFAWRMFLLLLFGLFNSAFFPDADILVLYSLVGILMIPVKNFSTPVLVTLAILLLLQPQQLYYLYQFNQNPAFKLPPDYSDILTLQVNEVIKNGNFFEIVATNITKGAAASIAWIYQTGRLFQVFGVFILGIIGGRLSIFDSTRYGRKFWFKILLAVIVAFLVIYLIKKGVYSRANSDALKTQITATFELWQNVLSTFFIISVFFILYSFKKIQQFFTPLVYLGKMSLTNYISQSVCGALIFAPFGLALADKMGITYSFILGIFLIICSVLFSRYWLKKHKQGPLETLWTRLTFLGTTK